MVEQNGKYGWIDKSGSYVIQPQYVQTTDFFEDGFAAVHAKDGKWGVIDKSGKYIITPIWDGLCFYG